MTSPFGFLHAEWPDVHEAASKAAAAVYPDPRTACFYARRALELAVSWAFKSDASLRLPYQDNLSALIHDPSFKAVAGEAVFSKARVINTLGNQAVHSHRPIQQFDALTAVRELFHVSFWLARTYARGAKPDAALAFDADALPKTAPVPKRAIDYLLKLKTELRERDEKLSEVLADKSALDEELKRLRAEVAEAKKASAAQPDTHDYSEAETRDYFIDLLLKEAGWPLDQPRDREFEVSGMPNAQGRGYVDYVLWADDGRPLAVVEAKRTRKSAAIGQQQAKLYADCLEAQFGQRPIIFYSNGYEHWLWDDASYPPRAVQGFFKKAELELMIQRRTSRKPLADAPVNTKIVERFYQARAIRRICEAFEQDHDRKALVVMATGAGKTRTVIALCDLLLQCNWAKRVLFLADRVALVNQTVNAFKAHLPDASPVNLVTEKDGEGRVFVSTYPTMMGLIDETKDGERRFGVGHFDLIVFDEAHRSVYQKYRAIFGYFDALLVGLTATPKDEIDINTYGLFDLERGVPTDAYGLEDAVKDGFLVPAKAVSVPLKFPREGITYDELTEEEQEQWDALEWDEDEGTPDRVEAPAVNKWLFNEDTVDKVLAHLMTRGQTVAGGDRLGKTIVFAKNQAHAEFNRAAVRHQLPALQGRVRAGHSPRCALRAEPDRRLLESVEAAAHRHLGGHARHGHRHPRGRETGLHQARAVEDEVLTDGRPRHAVAQGSVRSGEGQGVLLHPGLLREPGVLQPEPGRDGRIAQRVAREALVQDAAGARRRAGPSAGRGVDRARQQNLRAIACLRHAARNGAAHGRRVAPARRSRRHEPRQLHRPAQASARGEVREARGVDHVEGGLAGGARARRGRPAVGAGARG